MRTIRALVFYLFLGISVFVSASLVFITAPVLSAKTRYRQFSARWSRFVMWLLRVICDVHIDVRGVENIPPAGTCPLMVLSKHQSAWETIFLAGYLPNPISFVYKRELHWLPFFGWALKTMGWVDIDRSRTREAFQLFNTRGARLMRDGWWLTIFPEGTRVAPGVHKPYKTGGARLAIAGEARVLPVAHNAGECWARNSMAKHPGTITVSFGPVIESAGKTHVELNAEVEAWIENEMLTINGTARKKA